MQSLLFVVLALKVQPRKLVGVFSFSKESKRSAFSLIYES